MGGSNEDLGAENVANGRGTLQQLRGELWRLAPALKRAVRLLTGVVKALVLPAAFEQLRAASRAPFSVAPFGEWTVSGGASSPGWSMVVVGMPEHLTDEQVAAELVEGTEGDLPEPV